MANQEKVDLFGQLKKEDYIQSKKPVLINVKKGSYLKIDGKGAPGGEEFTAKTGALYAMAYTIKMTRKFDGRQDYVVGKLEALWSVDGDGDLASTPKDEWLWSMMIRTPDFVKNAELKSAVKALLEKGKDAAVKQVELTTMAEGRCVQMLHVGPYENEPETVAVMTEFATVEGYAPHGRHHEIYISDPRRVPPEKLKTILRLPLIKKPQ
jgi:hypothetical protein